MLCGLEDETIFHFLFSCSISTLLSILFFALFLCYSFQSSIFRNAYLKFCSVWPIRLNCFVQSTVLLKSLPISVFFHQTCALNCFTWYFSCFSLYVWSSLLPCSTSLRLACNFCTFFCTHIFPFCSVFDLLLEAKTLHK